MNNSSVSVTAETETGNIAVINYTIYALILLLPNTLAFISLWKAKSVPKKIKLPILNLIVSDLLTGLSFVSYLIILLLDLPKSTESILCYVQMIWTLTAAFASFSIVGGLAIDRCICIYYEYIYLTKITVKIILVWQVLTWIVSFFFATLIFIDTNWEAVCLYRYVVGKYGRIIHIYYSIFLRIISGVAFIAICIKMKRMINADKLKGVKRRGIFRTTSKVLVIGLTFHGMYFPLFCHHVFVLIFPDNFDDAHVFYVFASLLTVVNSFVNPFIYVWRFPECRLQLKIMICSWNKNIVNEENRKLKRILVSFLDPPESSTIRQTSLTDTDINASFS
ncbi:Melanocyte-stimulating hormone receptor [Mizuhopecten yessoensis]|uniref:Melanocyte-stimulating hormone receptor n=1 Tax=Mizuhopecten yessoensis TaxID=6573 RepID=A0A210QYR4_MIZYE|nr:Melanocyte-stimulating hormone receptor [Mizuhopecten yessoensis]